MVVFSLRRRIIQWGWRLPLCWVCCPKHRASALTASLMTPLTHSAMRVRQIYLLIYFFLLSLPHTSTLVSLFLGFFTLILYTPQLHIIPLFLTEWYTRKDPWNVRFLFFLSTATQCLFMHFNNSSCICAPKQKYCSYALCSI